jgi:hypothetical protein
MPDEHRLTAFDIAGLRRRLARRAERKEAQISMSCHLLTALLDEVEAGRAPDGRGKVEKATEF